MQIKLVLDYYHPWPNSIGFYEARRKEYIEKFYFVLQDPYFGDSLDCLSQGLADLAFSYPNRFIDRITKGEELIALFPIVKEPLESLFYLGEKIKNIALALSGSKVGYRRSPRLKALLNTINTTLLVNSNPMEIVEFYPQEPMPENLGNEIHFCFGALYVWEGLFSGGKIISYHKYSELGLPTYPGQILVTTKKFFQANQDYITQWSKGIKKGYGSVYKNLNESFEAFYEFIPYFPKEIVYKSILLLKEYFPEEKEWGRWNFQELENYQNFLYTQNLIPQKINLKEYFWSVEE